jgi:hypothetical protein
MVVQISFLYILIIYVFVDIGSNLTSQWNKKKKQPGRYLNFDIIIQIK